MDLNKINAEIESNNLYKFFVRHKKPINIIQGIFIIMLLVSINTYMVKDYFIKKQIRDKCGYEDNKIKCVCEKHFVDNWEELQRGNISINLNNTEDKKVNNVKMDR